MTSTDAPLVIQFVTGSRLHREQSRPSHFPIVGNGPPGTFVLLPSALRVSLPTDQIVAADETTRGVAVAFGGMRFTGRDAGGSLTFARVRDLWPEALLSPDRSWTMILDPAWVNAVHQDGTQVWPEGGPA